MDGPGARHGPAFERLFAATPAAPADPRLAALRAKVASAAAAISDDDVRALREAGVADDAIFDLVVAVAVEQARRRWDRAIAAMRAP